MATRKNRRTTPILGNRNPSFITEAQASVLRKWMSDNEPFTHDQFMAIPEFDYQTLYEVWKYWIDHPVLYPVEGDKWICLKRFYKYDILKYNEEIKETLEKVLPFLSLDEINKFTGMKSTNVIPKTFTYKRAKKYLRYLDHLIPLLELLRFQIEDEFNKPKEMDRSCNYDPMRQKGSLSSLIR